MTFTEEQFESLAPFERYFITATRSKYGYCGSKNAERIHAVLKEAGIYSPNHRTSYTCSRCVLDLLKRAGALWLADKQERIDAASAAEAAAKTLDESMKHPDLSVKKLEDGSVEVKTNYVEIEAPAPAKSATKSTKTVKAAKSAPKSKTAKK